MNLLSLEKYLQRFSANYLQFPVVKAIALILSLYIVSCSDYIKTDHPSSKANIVMETNPNTIIGEEANIELILKLAEDTPSINLESYLLRIKASDNDHTIFHYPKRALEIRLNEPQQLSLFSERITLTKDQDPLLISFTCIPSPQSDHIILSFELLDAHQRCIQTCAVNWLKGSNQIGIPPVNIGNQLIENIKHLSIQTDIPQEKESRCFTNEYNKPGLEDDSKTNQSSHKRSIKKGKSKRPIKKIKGNLESETEKGIHPSIIDRYHTKHMVELAHLANENDNHAQELIATHCLQSTLSPLLENLLAPFSWQEIQEKAAKDQRYVYLLLNFSKKAPNHDLYKEIFASIERHAHSGDLVAQTNLGYMYDKGLGVERDPTKAIEWYMQATNQEYARAQYHLGNIFYAGKGVDRNYQEAVKLYRAAANQGDPLAQHDLGYMYENNLGVGDSNNNQEEAIKWYLSAASQRYAEAEYSLGIIYEQINDNSTAKEWFKKAAKQGHSKAQYSLASILYKEGELAKENQESYKRALKWFQKAAEQGHRLAQYALGVIYINGEIIDQNYVKGMDYLNKAAEKGYPPAQNELGNLYALGEGVERDMDQAIRWFKKAARQGHVDAQTNLGFCYKKQSNDKKAIKWYNKAAEQGDENAQTRLGKMYYKGQGTDKNLAKAIFWFMQAKNSDELLNIFDMNPSLDIPDTAHHEAIQNMESKLLSAWQGMLVQIKLARADTHATVREENYQELEEIMAKLMHWRYRLSTQPHLMISCICFKNQSDVDAIKNAQLATGTIPYVNQHDLDDHTYLSFEQENVLLAEEITNEINNKYLYHTIKEVLDELKFIYQQARIKAAGKACYLEEKLNIEKLDKTDGLAGGLDEKDLINSKKKKLDRENQLTRLFATKLETLEKETAKFEIYYQLVFKEIQRGLATRNQKFQVENAYLFN